MDETAATRMIAKLRTFTTTLDADERVLLGVLIAPGIVRAYGASPEVTGFAMVDWSPDALAASLGTALREAGIGVVGLGTAEGDKGGGQE